jgi:hypothetical protein
MDKNQIIIQAYSLLTKSYSLIKSQHERTYSKEHYTLIKEMELFELQHGINIEKLTRQTNSPAAKKIVTA